MQEELNQQISPQTSNGNNIQPGQMPVPESTMPQQIPQATSQHQYAGFWLRLAAGFIDGYLFGLPLLLIMAPPFIRRSIDLPGSFLFISIYAPPVLLFGLQSLLLLRYGGTLGKLFCGIRIINKNGSNPGLLTIIIREAPKFYFPILFAPSFLLVAFDKEKQAFHDKLVSTHVVIIKPLNTTRKVVVVLLSVLAPIFWAYFAMSIILPFGTL